MSASKSYAEAAKSPPSTLKTPKQAAQGASSNNGGRSACLPVSPPLGNQFAAGGNQQPGARRSGSQQTGTQYEPGNGPPPNKKPTYSAHVFTANRKANDARDNSAMAQKTTGAVQLDSGNGSVQLPDTRRSAVNTDVKAKNTGRGSTTKAATVEAEAKMRAAAAVAAAKVKAAEEEAAAKMKAAEEEAAAKVKAANEEAAAHMRAAAEEAAAQQEADEEEAAAQREADDDQMDAITEATAAMALNNATQDAPSNGGCVAGTAPLEPPNDLNSPAPSTEAKAADANAGADEESRGDEMESDDLREAKDVDDVTAKCAALELNAREEETRDATTTAPIAPERERDDSSEDEVDKETARLMEHAYEGIDNRGSTRGGARRGARGGGRGGAVPLRNDVNAPTSETSESVASSSSEDGSRPAFEKTADGTVASVSRGGFRGRPRAFTTTCNGLTRGQAVPAFNPNVPPLQVQSRTSNGPASGFVATGFPSTTAPQSHVQASAESGGFADGFANNDFPQEPSTGDAFRGARGGRPFTRGGRGGRGSGAFVSPQQPQPGNSGGPTASGFGNAVTPNRQDAQAFDGASIQQGMPRGGIGNRQRGGRGGSRDARNHLAPDCPQSEQGDGLDFDENSKWPAPNNAHWPYYVIQHGGGHYIAIFDFEKAASKKSGVDHVTEDGLPPLVIRIRQEYVTPEKSSLYPPANMEKPCLTIGTRLQIRKVYRFTRMNAQVFGPTKKAHRLPDFLDPETTLVNPSGHARKYELSKGPRPWPLPAIVVSIGRIDNRARVTVRHSKKAVVLPEHSLHLVRGADDNSYTFTEGDVVMVWLTVAPTDGYMHPENTYMLPAQHPMIDREREVMVRDLEREVFVWQVEPWPADKLLNMDDFFGDKSPATSGFVNESARLDDYGNLLYAATARAHELLQLRLAKGDYRGKLTPIQCEKNNRAYLSMVFDENEQATFDAKAQWWTDHSLFDVYVNTHEKEVISEAAQATTSDDGGQPAAVLPQPQPMEEADPFAPVVTAASVVMLPDKDDANFSHYKCVGVAAIDWVRIDDAERKIEARLTFESDVPGQIVIPPKSMLHKVISGHSTSWLRPNVTNTGFKFDFDQLAAGLLSAAYHRHYPCMRPIAEFLKLDKQFDVLWMPSIEKAHPLRRPAGDPLKERKRGEADDEQEENADEEQLMEESGRAEEEQEANADDDHAMGHNGGDGQQEAVADEDAPMEHNGSKAQERAREIRELLERLRNWTPPRPLNDEQQETVDYIVDGEPLVFMSAPPGSGKTYVAAVLAAMLFISWRIAELEEELRLLEAPPKPDSVPSEQDTPGPRRGGDKYAVPDEDSAAKKKNEKVEPSVAMLDEHGELKMAGMLKTAETNHATMNLGEAVHETGLFEPDDVLMVISHHYARRHQNEINAAVWKDYLLVEHLRRILQREEGKLDEKAKRVISDYIAKATSRDAIRVDQNKALTILLQYSRPRIIICTLGTARRIEGKLAPMIKYLVIDEIGQVSEVSFVCLMLALKWCRCVLLAGDHRQLGLYDVEIPTHVRAYGFTSLVEVVTVKRPPKACTRLRKVYRSHPEVVEKVIKPLYDDEVECGIDASARTLLEKIPFETKDFGHVLVLDAKRGQAKAKDSKSWTNEHHTEITVRFVQSVHKEAPTATIVVLCYYTRQQHEIADKLRDMTSVVQVHTITGYQGRQADVTVLVTTRTGYDQDPAPEFVLDAQRTTVGLSRLKELLVVVGDVQLLLRGGSWRSVLGKLSGNHILRPSRLRALLSPIEGENAPPYDHDKDEDELLEVDDWGAPLVSAAAANAPTEEMWDRPTSSSAPVAPATSGALTNGTSGAQSDATSD